MLTVRFSERHVAPAAEIERLSFSSPWSEESLKTLLGGYGVAFAVEDDGVLVSYAGMVSVLDEGEIVTVATHPDFRRRGFARTALEALLSYAAKKGIKTVTLEVRASNHGAEMLYSSLGFIKVGLRRHFYTLPDEDAVIMNKTL